MTIMKILTHAWYRLLDSTRGWFWTARPGRWDRCYSRVTLAVEVLEEREVLSDFYWRPLFDLRVNNQLLVSTVAVVNNMNVSNWVDGTGENATRYQRAPAANDVLYFTNGNRGTCVFDALASPSFAAIKSSTNGDVPINISFARDVRFTGDTVLDATPETSVLYFTRLTASGEQIRQILFEGSPVSIALVRVTGLEFKNAASNQLTISGAINFGSGLFLGAANLSVGLRNFGTATWQDDGRIELDGNTGIHNERGGVFNISANANIDALGPFSAGFGNSGTLNVTSDVTISSDFINAGRLNVTDGGYLHLNGQRAWQEGGNAITTLNCARISVRNTFGLWDGYLQGFGVIEGNLSTVAPAMIPPIQGSPVIHPGMMGGRTISNGSVANLTVVGDVQLNRHAMLWMRVDGEGDNAWASTFNVEPGNGGRGYLTFGGATVRIYKLGGAPPVGTVVPCINFRWGWPDGPYEAGDSNNWGNNLGYVFRFRRHGIDLHVVQRPPQRGAANAVPGNPVLLADFQNDPDFNGPLSVSKVIGDPQLVGATVTTTNGGSFMALEDGSIDYVPPQYVYGEDTIQVTLTDGNIEKELTLTFANPDPAAAVRDAEYSLDYNGVLAMDLGDYSRGLLDNAVNFDTESMQITAVNGYPAFVGMEIETTAGGHLTVNADGTATYSAPPNYFGDDSATITVSDISSNTASGTITFHVVKTYAYDADYTLLADSSLDQAAGGLLDFAGDVNGDPIWVSAIAGNANFSGFAIATAQGGSIVAQSSGAFVYSPPPGTLGAYFLGDDSVTVTITDGQSSSTFTANFHVVDLLARDAEYSFLHDRTTNVPTMTDLGLLNYADSASNASLSVVAVNGNAGAIGIAEPTAAGGTVVVQSSGNFAYTPPANFIGYDWFSFTVSDGAITSTAYVNIEVVDQAPVINNSPSYSVQAGQTLYVPDMMINVGLLHSAYVSDPDDDALTIVRVNDDADAVGDTVYDAAGNALTVQADGSFVFTAAANFSGDFTFTAEISDGILTTQMVVTIHVNP